MTTLLAMKHHNLTSVEPSPSADRVHLESLLSALVFCIHLPAQFWQTEVSCDPLLISLFGLQGIKHFSSVCVHKNWRIRWVGGSIKGGEKDGKRIYFSNSNFFLRSNLPSRLHLVDIEALSLHCKSFRSSSTTDIAVCV